MFWEGFYKAANDNRVAKVALIHDGKILTGRRRDSGKWTEPGGHLEPGERARDGAIREVKEETGIDLQPSDLSSLGSKQVRKPDGTLLTIHTFVASMSDKAKSTMLNDPDKEVHKWHWVPFGQAIKKDLHVPFERNALFHKLLEDSL